MARGPQDHRRRWLLAAGGVLGLLAGTLAVAAVLWQWGRRVRRAPLRRVEIVRRFPHDPQAYCQGLLFHEGFLYEGTGTYGQSSLRKVELQTGRVLQRHELPDRLFGEGIALWDQRIYQLTWKSMQAIVYDLQTFRQVKRLPYRGEGWGLTSDGQHLIMSDGTDTLRFMDPETLEVVRRLTVRDGRRRIRNLNELEYVDGLIYANVWQYDRIAKIHPRTGRVVAWLDLSHLYPAARRTDVDQVLNGIAYDSQSERLFVTGKNWPELFEIRESR
jgi:glutamine cyclotransferase